MEKQGFSGEFALSRLSNNFTRRLFQNVCLHTSFQFYSVVVDSQENPIRSVSSVVWSFKLPNIHVSSLPSNSGGKLVVTDWAEQLLYF